MVTASDPETLSVASVQQPTTSPPLLSKPPTKWEAYDDIEAIYENLTFRKSDPIDVALQKALFVRQYHKNMKEKIRFMKRHYQYPIDPDEELDYEDEEGMVWDQDGVDDSEDFEDSDWEDSDETECEEEQEEDKEKEWSRDNTDIDNQEGYMDLLWSAIMQRLRATDIDKKSEEEFEEDKDRKEEEKGDRDDSYNENNKECQMDLLRRAIIQRQRALGIHVDDKSNDRNYKEEKEKEEEEEEEEEEQHKKYCYNNKDKQEIHMSCLREALKQRQRVLRGCSKSSEENAGKIEIPDSEEKT